MKRQYLIIIMTLLVMPVRVLAQADGSIPIEKPTPTESSVNPPTPVTTTVVPRETASVVTPSATPSATPITSNAILSPSPTMADVIPVESSFDISSIPARIMLGVIGLSILGYAIYRRKTKTKNEKKDRCDSIRELLEQKKRELEEFIRNWPEEKIKSLAQQKIVGELKKDEDVKKVLETAESLKARRDKLKEAIDLLQKKYDLCMLELPSLNKSKVLKFKGFKAQWIADGTKTATIRLFDDKNLKAGDHLELLNSDNGELFSKAKVTEVIEKKLGEIDLIDLDGHEKWNTKEEMLESFKKYYGDKINLDTLAKIVRFKIIK